jgi:adenylosuccinate synthase
MRATAVIGAAFGDEGKGLLTDHYVSELRAHGRRPIVCRFNGGANAGHTVVRGAKRHVFSHFGAGSLLEAETYLSEFFVANPLLWQKEWRQLVELGVEPVVYLDRQAPLTVPYDIMINQFAEEHRGNHRHGSCGIGIHETVVRNESVEFSREPQSSNIPRRSRIISTASVSTGCRSASPRLASPTRDKGNRW